MSKQTKRKLIIGMILWIIVILAASAIVAYAAPQWITWLPIAPGGGMYP